MLPQLVYKALPRHRPCQSQESKLVKHVLSLPYIISNSGNGEGIQHTSLINQFILIEVISLAQYSDDGTMRCGIEIRSVGGAMMYHALSVSICCFLGEALRVRVIAC